MNMPKSGSKTPFRRELGDGLVLKTAASAEDVERVAVFDTKVFGEAGVGEFCRRLFLYHPNTQISDLIFVEDEKMGEVVSSICLIPMDWSYENVTLKVAEMGIVGTLEPYRRRGLIRAQADYFKELLAKREFDLSCIEGIPYFYRQFGYEYAMPLEGGYSIEMHQIPDPGQNEPPQFSCRPQTAADLPFLKRLYDEAAQELAIHALRNDSIWQYLWMHAPATATGYEGWVIEDKNGKIAGYFQIQSHPFGESLTVREVSRLSYDESLAVLRHLKKLAIERKKPNIRLSLPPNCVLVKTAKYHQASDLGTYAWQIHIPDMARFLRTIAPVLERRLAESPFAGLTEEVGLNFYQETVALRFAQGRIEEIESLGSVGGRIRIPPRAAVLLVLGYRDCEELRKSWPDMGMPPKEAYLMDVLFPRMTSHLYVIF